MSVLVLLKLSILSGLMVSLLQFASSIVLISLTLLSWSMGVFSEKSVLAFHWRHLHFALIIFPSAHGLLHNRTFAPCQDLNQYIYGDLIFYINSHRCCIFSFMSQMIQCLAPHYFYCCCGSIVLLFVFICRMDGYNLSIALNIQLHFGFQ